MVIAVAATVMAAVSMVIVNGAVAPVAATMAMAVVAAIVGLVMAVGAVSLSRPALLLSRRATIPS